MGLIAGLCRHSNEDKSLMCETFGGDLCENESNTSAKVGERMEIPPNKKITPNYDSLSF